MQCDVNNMRQVLRDFTRFPHISCGVNAVTICQTSFMSWCLFLKCESDEKSPTSCPAFVKNNNQNVKTRAPHGCRKSVRDRHIILLSIASVSPQAHKPTLDKIHHPHKAKDHHNTQQTNCIMWTNNWKVDTHTRPTPNSRLAIGCVLSIFAHLHLFPSLFSYPPCACPIIFPPVWSFIFTPTIFFLHLFSSLVFCFALLTGVIVITRTVYFSLSFVDPNLT